jgi:hypothetical protein
MRRMTSDGRDLHDAGLVLGPGAIRQETPAVLM